MLRTRTRDIIYDGGAMVLVIDKLKKFTESALLLDIEQQTMSYETSEKRLDRLLKYTYLENIDHTNGQSMRY